MSIVSWIVHEILSGVKQRIWISFHIEEKTYLKCCRATIALAILDRFLSIPQVRMKICSKNHWFVVVAESVKTLLNADRIPFITPVLLYKSNIFNIFTVKRKAS
ncbi:MAG: hypothetical protein QME50_06975 [Candidatus Bathyarchaeota archaeon]|nr:hypothetical protein [Candidatus Bathyarchaeota archaeon]